MVDIKSEIDKIEYEEEPEEVEEVEEPEPEQVKPKRTNNRGQSREKMIEIGKIRSEKARLRREEKEELKRKEEEIMRIKKEKIDLEYEEAQRIKEALSRAKKATKKAPEIKQEQKVYKTVSRDILKERYLEEAKRRVMMDLFS